MSAKMLACCLVMVFGAACTAGAADADPPRVRADDKTQTIESTGKPLLQYRFAEVPFKPYAAAFFTPQGVNILRDAPHDHLHHHALMFAVAANDVNFWEEKPDCGTQIHLGFEELPGAMLAGIPWAGFVEKLQWCLPNAGAPVLDERRVVRAARDSIHNASLLLWDSELSVPAGKDSVKLTGAHYYGLGMRFLESMDKGGEFLYASETQGELVRGDERLTPAAWCAYTAKADGKPVTVAMFDCPSNPRYPARWFTMQTPFAYLAATRNLWKEPLELKAGAPLAFRHAIALWDGTVSKDIIEKMCIQLGDVWK